MRLAPTPPATNIDHLRVLQRRLEWLQKRIDDAAQKGYSPKFDVAECDALLWLLSYVETEN